MGHPVRVRHMGNHFNRTTDGYDGDERAMLMSREREDTGWHRASEKRETTTSRWTMHLNRLEMGTPDEEALPGIEERREWGHTF